MLDPLGFCLSSIEIRFLFMIGMGMVKDEG